MSDGSGTPVQPPAVGVGPWSGPPPTQPDGEPDDRYDPELLTAGDTRNVVDRYRYWRHEAIVADLAEHAHELHVAVENWGHDFNIGSVVRTANAMGAGGFHIVGRRRWNRRGAMVTDRYLTEYHHGAVADLSSWVQRSGHVLLGVDNIAGAVPLETFDLPRRAVLLLGQEGPGLTPEAVAACVAVLQIAQFGSTRSMNAGAAAAIAMHAWVRRYAFGQRATRIDEDQPGTAT